ncbi:cobW/HypB/UreG, nucleotide-binding domain protein [Methyloversatilis sp. RAC08]|uniref:CobW family GTP-binding protein n=1 Tax=Methyloversatilis sp. RAC08 TaxID=1842540 RepID=UPI00083D1AB1|nr:GTP-binding protein [Methyloversatilis sp. RAC08]AOF80529.1 cobW/HypB/UreG, nucleotide-binding domain protein [Methyloversatilis sp. RAC08]
MNDSPLPIILLTGFLGSGKTTLLNRLLASPGMSDTLVVINEYGDASLDHLLVTHSAEQPVVELPGGCVCCSLRGDLAQTLRDAHWRFARAGRRQFERIVIETTGLADPAPILRTLTQDNRIAARYRLRCTLTVVDALHAAGTLATQDEAVRQIAAADRLLISKSDLADADALGALCAQLERINPFAPQIDLQRVSDSAELMALLDVPPARPLRFRPVTTDAPHAIRADSFAIDQPIRTSRLDAWLAGWPDIAGPGLLRMKALLDVEGRTGPLALHGVQHTLHPPTPLADWPDADRGSTIVFITRGISACALREYVALLGHD